MEEHKDRPDRARRRLMKMAAYVPAGIVSLAAARAHAARLAVASGTKSATSTGVKTGEAGARRRCARSDATA